MLSYGIAALDPTGRGYHVVYRDNEINHCPGCGRTHWHIGRSLAECAFCATALPLAESFRQPSAAVIVRRSLPIGPSAFAA